MSIVIGADAAGLRLKEVVKDFLEKENFHVVDVTAEGQDFVDVTLAVAAEVNKEEQNLGIVIDEEKRRHLLWHRNVCEADLRGDCAGREIHPSNLNDDAWRVWNLRCCIVHALCCRQERI